MEVSVIAGSGAAAGDMSYTQVCVEVSAQAVVCGPAPASHTHHPASTPVGSTPAGSTPAGQADADCTHNHCGYSDLVYAHDAYTHGYTLSDHVYNYSTYWDGHYPSSDMYYGGYGGYGGYGEAAVGTVAVGCEQREMVCGEAGSSYAYLPQHTPTHMQHLSMPCDPAVPPPPGDSHGDSHHDMPVIRDDATQRERTRMHMLNDAFDELRRIVPRHTLNEHQKLSKIATLRSAIQYIMGLVSVLEEAGAAVHLVLDTSVCDRRGRRRGRLRRNCGIYKSPAMGAT